MSVARTARRRFTRAHCRVYRATGGPVGAHVHGAPVLLRGTGLRLRVCGYGESCLLRALSRHPLWLLSIEP